MVTMGVFPFQGKTHMVEPGIEPWTSWLVVRNSDHQDKGLVPFTKYCSSLSSTADFEQITYLLFVSGDCDGAQIMTQTCEGQALSFVKCLSA